VTIRVQVRAVVAVRLVEPPAHERSRTFSVAPASEPSPNMTLARRMTFVSMVGGPPRNDLSNAKFSANKSFSQEITAGQG